MRRSDGVVRGSLGDDEFLMVLRHGDVKAITRNWESFTSDVAFRVPIPSEADVRSVRQLPIESDPPRHTEYRAIVQEVFGRETSRRIRPDVVAIVDRLLDQAITAGEVEVVRDFAVPVQSRALALLLGRPQGEATRWISWGTHVFRDFSDRPEGNARELDHYLDEVIDAAFVAPGDDFFGLLVRSKLGGRPLSRDEVMGFANLAFAGGRDTLIHLIVNSLHHLATNPQVLARAKQDPTLLQSATEEYLRYFSPIAHIGRVVTEPTELLGRRLEPDDTVSICFASANRDETVFDRADELVLDRRPNRHVAFGHGPHTCLGAPHSRMVLTTVLERVAERAEGLEVIDAAAEIEDLGPFTRAIGHERLRLGIH
jgi:cytochrome P450